MVIKLLTALVITFLVTALACPFFIRRMEIMQYGQQIRDDGPSRHSIKAGTPTMGGLVILFAAVLVSMIMAGRSPLLYLLLLVTLGCGLIGFIDDYFKVARSRSLGLKARSKLIGEFALTALFLILLTIPNLYSSVVITPIFKLSIDLGFLYPIFVFLFITGFSNSVNLTDGVDGLAAGTVFIALAAYIYIALGSGFPEAAIFCAALAGACLGFLVFNRHPARLFMGDVGSLALGGSLAAVAVLTKSELFLLIIGAVFVLEALSVIAQVISFRLTGRRIFLMSPLHHHFELKGWSEWRVVTTFWSAGLVFAVLGMLAYNR